MATTYDILKYLSENDVEYSLLTHEPITTALNLAKTIKLPAHIIARTILIKTEKQFWMIVLPADRKVNIEAVCRILGANCAREADAGDWSFYFPDCDMDTMPPFGNLYGINILVEKSLEVGRRIVFSAYSRTQSIFMRWDAYVNLVKPIVAEICDESSAPQFQRLPQNIMA